MITQQQWDEAGVGVKPDLHVAKSLGVGRRLVAKERSRRGIGRVKIPRYKVDWHQVGLGNRPDSRIAEELGCSRRIVTKKRLQLGITAFSGIYYSQEGGTCRSLYEAMYDAWLHWKEIPHQHEVKILQYVADFKVGEEYHEIAGMTRFKLYEEKLIRKKAALSRAGVPVKWLIPEDVQNLFLGCPITLNINPDRKCNRCGCATYDIVKGFCPKCYPKEKVKWAGIPTVCIGCGHEFMAPQRGRKYCGTDCYHCTLTHVGD